MDLPTRKIEFVKAFLKIQSEEVIDRLEKLLKKESLDSNNDRFNPMSEEELNNRVAESELDFKNNRFKSSEELLSKYE